MSLIFSLLFLVQALPADSLDGPDPVPPADPCPQGEISHIFIDNHSIFDPARLPDDDRIRWAYVLANRIHMRTRADFIRDELLFREGDCLDPEAIRETARVLREFRFIAGADVFDVEQPDGSSHVVVDTRDEWSTKLALSVRFDEGLRLEGGSLVEENLMGRGISAGAFWISREQQRSVGALAEIPRVAQTNWDVRAAVASTRIGEMLDQAVIYPFQGERVGTAFRQEVSHRRDLFSYVLPAETRNADGDLLSHFLLPVVEQRLQVGMSHRFGEPGSFLIAGGGVSYERIHPSGLESVRAVRGREFAEHVPVDAALAAPLASQLHARRAFRINLRGGVRQIRFAERRGLDTVDGVQDLPLGREAILTLGRSVGSTGPDRPPDLLARVNLFRGGELGPILSFATLAGEARREAGVGGTRGWRDTLLEFQTHNYWHPEGPGSPTVLLRVAAQGGWRTDAPFQLTLGGPDGIRGYSDTALPGARRAVASAEGRWKLPNPLADFMDLGMTVFGDTGRMWAGDVPFGTDTGWRSSVGAGLRVGFPAGSASVIRVDVAIPTDGAGPRSPIVRISAREWLGLLDDTRSRQLLRSRRSGLTPDYSGVVQNRRPPG